MRKSRVYWALHIDVCLKRKVSLVRYMLYYSTSSSCLDVYTIVSHLVVLEACALGSN